MQNGSDGKDKTVKRLPSIKRLSGPRLPTTSSSSGNASSASGSPTTVLGAPSKPSGAAKKSFVPNLNSTRNVPTPKVENANEEGSSRFKVKGERQWKDRPKKEFIQTNSVFSDGVASQQMGGVGRSGLPIPSGGPSDSLSSSKSLKAEVVHEDSIDDILNAPFISDLKNEQSPLSLVEDKLNSCKLTAADKARSSTTDGCENEMQEKLYIFQFPSLLPLSSVFENQVAETNGDSKDSPTPDTSENVLEKALSIKDLPEGRIGSFEILENGEMRLVFGDSENNEVVMDCSSGFENIAAMSLVYHDSVAQTLRHVAEVDTKLVCSPDFTSLLKKSESDCSSTSSEDEKDGSHDNKINATEFQESGS